MTLSGLKKRTALFCVYAVAAAFLLDPPHRDEFSMPGERASERYAVLPFEWVAYHGLVLTLYWDNRGGRDYLKFGPTQGHSADGHRVERLDSVWRFR